MKKKRLTIVCAIVLCIASMFMFTACSVSIPKGDMVSEEKWRSAIENTGNIENFTMEASLDVKSSVSGTIYNRKYVEGSSTPTYTSSAITGKATVSYSALYLYDKEGKRSYSEEEYVLDAKGTEDGEKEKEYEYSLEKEYYEPGDTVGDKTVYWVAEYSLEKMKSTEGHGERESYWDASETSRFASQPTSDMFSDVYFYVDTDEKTTAKSIKELYSEFSYSNGKYTATLYRRVSIQNILSERIKCTVTISFNASENCVTGIGIKTEGEDTAQKENEYDIKYSYSGKSAYSITKINQTDVSKKASKKITKAIDKAKKEKEKDK